MGQTLSVKQVDDIHALSGMDKNSINLCYSRFCELKRSSDDDGIYLEDIQQIPVFRDHPLSSEIIRVLKKNENDISLDFMHLTKYLGTFQDSSSLKFDQLQSFFHLLNEDRDNSLKRNELYHMLSVLSKDELNDEQRGEIVESFFSLVDPIFYDAISFEEFLSTFLE
ncbi:hypothetical protein PCE1_003145 [Barthelona sp. PCE]